MAIYFWESSSDSDNDVDKHGCSSDPTAVVLDIMEWVEAGAVDCGAEVAMIMDDLQNEFDDIIGRQTVFRLTFIRPGQFTIEFSTSRHRRELISITFRDVTMSSEELNSALRDAIKRRLAHLNDPCDIVNFIHCLGGEAAIKDLFRIAEENRSKSGEPTGLK